MFERVKSTLANLDGRQLARSIGASAKVWRRSAEVSAKRVEPASTWAGRALFWSFIFMVIVPTIFSAFYFIFIASDEFLSETRLTVRAASEEKQALSDTLSMFSKLGISGGKSTIQDSYIVLNYIKSQSIVEDIGGRDYLESKFSLPEIDWLSKLSRGKKNEELRKYWENHVFPSIDTLSGIVTVKVFAFRPDDAREIAGKIVELSEKLINNISERARATAVVEAENELRLNQLELASVQADLLKFRNASVTIDPVATATSIGELIGKLVVERSEIENFKATFSGSLNANSPALRFQQSRIDSIDAQIAELRRKLTSTNSADKTISSDLATFEQLKLREKFAEQKYSIAQTSLDRAKQDLIKQKLFLVLVVPPNLPEFALFPERGVDLLLSFVLCFVLWGIASLVSASVTDHFIA
jgi:BexC/CtrB/KpsE family polysaccharide export inner-membrane protein